MCFSADIFMYVHTYQFQNISRRKEQLLPVEAFEKAQSLWYLSCEENIL